MQASRVSSRALKHLAVGTKQARSLHMTGPATFSSLLTSDPTSGSKAELIDRLSTNEVSNTRAFNTASQDSKRPIPEPANPGKPIRHFNTSRSLKAVGDSSTIEFAYIPDFDPDAQAAPVEQVRVPILPQTVASDFSKAHTAQDSDEAVMVPTIMTVAADSTHIHAPSAMSEVSDNNTIDFQGMAATVASKLGKPVEESAGMARQLWSGFVDDILGPKSQGGSHV